MNIDHESNLSWVRDESGLHLKTFRESVAEFQAYFMSLSPPERVWSTELIAERKREAAAEAAKTGRNE